MVERSNISSRIAGFLRISSRVYYLLPLALGACSEPARSNQVNMQIHRGINILSGISAWSDPENSQFQLHYLRTISAAGYDFVRINAPLISVQSDDGIVPDRTLQYLDLIIEEAGKNGLSAIIDLHEDRICANASSRCEDSIPKIWKLLSERYKKASPSVIFEILNEPRDHMNDVWNNVVKQSISIIRKNNPDRQIIVDCASASDFESCTDLSLPPEDRNLIVSFHYYRPMQFTHQGAWWSARYKNLKNFRWGTPTDMGVVANDFDRVSRMAQAQNRPVLLGEFGAFEGGGSRPEDRDLYRKTVVSEATRHGFSWAYWQFSGDFVAFDVARGRWVPDVQDLLIPSGNK